MQHYFKIYFALLTLILTGTSACKKAQVSVDDAEEIVSPTTGTRTQFTLDSIFLYAKQVYLWNEALPGYAEFNPRQKYVGVGSDITTFRKELFDISQLKINVATGSPYELPVYFENPKYSNLQLGRSIPGNTAGIGQPDAAVLTSKVINNGNTLVAYLALSSFPSLNSSKAALDQTFAEFAVSNPKVIIIDLRSNGGGYLETAEYVADLIVPSSLNGKVMYSEAFNPAMQNGTVPILKHQPYLDANGKTAVYNGRSATMADVDYTIAGNTYKFNKKGSLQTIQSVYFIVSGNTASASEMLISSLKPYFDVKLIGEKTYGKPVGFFGINIDQYSVYLSSFLIKNANGWSDYFTGMQPDVMIKGIDNPVLGDPDELCLNTALSLINGTRTLTANKLATTGKIANVKADILPINNVESVMLENRLRLRK
ncbi:S41 family peptidase [Pedobacter alluvionis]|uniref:Peptidase S41-like protein n=1 Tax=Pedobacter alluvionis TaxID=475253 RepID=A0A497Y0D8_9SPHI|nr:S41 family peptidase [Pedobacter alluvionis]RLJ75055.1 peptidase S41-like protein [Pedobacter alluvionis]